MEEKFIHYLIDIGFIDKKTEYEIRDIYHNVISQNNYMKFNEIMTTVLINFLENLTQIQKKFICFHLPVKFLNQIKTNRNKKLKNIIQKLSLKRSLKLIKYFNIWKNNCNIKSGIVKSYLNNIINTVNKATPNARNIFRSSNSNSNGNCCNINNRACGIKYNSNCGNSNNNNNKVITNYCLFNVNPVNYRNNTTISNSISKVNKTDVDTLNSSSKKNGVAKNLKANNNNNCKTIKKKYTNKTMKNIKKLCSNKKPTLNDINNLEYNSTQKDTIDTNKYSSSNVNNYNTRSMSHSDNFKDVDINKINPNSNNFDYYNKLYNDFQKYDEDKYLKAIEYENLNAQEFTFKPKFIDINSINGIFHEKTFNEFQQRQNYFKNKKTKNNQNIRNIIDNEFNDKYSFSPKINRSKSNKRYYSKTNYPSDYEEIYMNNYFNNIKPYSHENIENSFMYKSIPGHIRLYEDSKNRARKQSMKLYEKNKNINDLANSMCRNRTKLNYQKINYLHKSKEIDNIYSKTKNKVEKEEGLTFKPSINHSHYLKRIYSTFMERNTGRNDLNGGFYTKNFYNGEYRSCGSSKKKYNKRQKKEIIDRVVNRLYTDSKDTTMKSSEGCSKFMRKYSHGTTNTRSSYKKF